MRLRAADNMKPRSSPPRPRPRPWPGPLITVVAVVARRSRRQPFRLAPNRRQVAAVAAKALLAEVVGHTACDQAGHALREHRGIAMKVPHRNREAISLERTARQLALMLRGRDDFVSFSA